MIKISEIKSNTTQMFVIFCLSILCALSLQAETIDDSSHATAVKNNADESLKQQMNKQDDDSSYRNELNGAFGLSFGKPYVPVHQDHFKLPNGSHVYTITPPTPNKLFSQYKITVSRDTHVIVSILAISPPLSENVCAQERDTLFRVLKEKYAKVNERDKGKASHFSNHTIKQQHRSVQVECVPFTPDKDVLNVRYFNGRESDMLNIPAALEIKSIDTSGL